MRGEFNTLNILKEVIHALIFNILATSINHNIICNNKCLGMCQTQTRGKFIMFINSTNLDTQCVCYVE